MTATKTATKTAAKATARTTAATKDVLARLVDAGEEALQRLNDVPGGRRLAETMHALRVRVDETQRKLLHIEPLERRVADLEKRLDALTTTLGAAPAQKPRATRAKTAAKPAPKTTQKPS